MATATRGVKIGVVIAGLAGLAAATAAAAVVGLADVGRAIAALGLRGLVVLVGWSPLPLFLLGLAWRLVTPAGSGAGLGGLVFARAVRDGAGELLPFSHIGGFVAGARAAVLRGLSGRIAFATTVVDVTAELIAQLGFTALGVVMLIERLAQGSARSAVLGAALAGLGLTAAGAAGFVLLQRRGGGLIEALARRLLPADAAAQVGDLSAAIVSLYEDPWSIAGGAATHLAAWVASGLGVWLALAVAGVKIDPVSVLAIEALVAAARSAIAVAPMGLGVQETAYAVVGPLFGLPSELSLALSLIKRARDLLVGGPALAAWQAMEGAQAMRRARSATLAKTAAQP